MSILVEAENIIKRRWGSVGRGWKVFFLIGLVVASIFYFLGKLVKALSIGGFRNRDLYLPRIGRRGRR